MTQSVDEMEAQGLTDEMVMTGSMDDGVVILSTDEMEMTKSIVILLVDETEQWVTTGSMVALVLIQYMQQ
jgi:hypothetical protein